jgi:uncharacterized protein (TIGR00725 family)
LKFVVVQQNNPYPPLRIAVCGTSEPTAELAAMAEEVGVRLAQSGAVVLCGGLGGVMEAACRGAQQASGLTIGILPSRDAHSANRYVTVPIVTGMGEARNIILINSAEAVIAIGGGWGTLSEIAFARRAHLEVFGLQTWETGGAVQLVEVVASAEAAVTRSLAAARQRRIANGDIRRA